MILGDNLFDADIIIDFKTEMVSIDYSNNEIDTLMISPHLSSLLFILYILPITFIANIILIFYLLYHRLIAVNYATTIHLNKLKHLKHLIKLYKLARGTSTRIFSSNLNSTSLSVESDVNILFDYKLTGDYEKYCESITLHTVNETRRMLNTEFLIFGNTIFTINFSQIPKQGSATITYI